ncbi:hypothetical protein F5B18DRAFT_637496 [Nemania serpens]|nr:hypothetical protein F5B18DRAFT_637496 [Nemania serpens]
MDLDQPDWGDLSLPSSPVSGEDDFNTSDDRLFDFFVHTPETEEAQMLSPPINHTSSLYRSHENPLDLTVELEIRASSVLIHNSVQTATRSTPRLLYDREPNLRIEYVIHKRIGARPHRYRWQRHLWKCDTLNLGTGIDAQKETSAMLIANLDCLVIYVRVNGEGSPIELCSPEAGHGFKGHDTVEGEEFNVSREIIRSMLLEPDQSYTVQW